MITETKVVIGQRFEHYDQKAMVNRLGRCAVCCEYIAVSKRKQWGQYFICPSCKAMEESLLHA